LQTGELETVDTITVAKPVQKLFEYIRDRGTLVAITNYNKCAVSWWTACTSDKRHAKGSALPASAAASCLILTGSRLAFRELLMHADVSKAVTESIRMGTALWESECKCTDACGKPMTRLCPVRACELLQSR
jgi:hypothetical protein